MAYEHRTVEPKWQARWREAGLHKTPSDPGEAEVLRAGHVPLPFGRRAARRPLRGLHRDRRDHALEADAGVPRAAPDGLGRVRPARRELRHQARRPPARDDRRGDRQLPPADRRGRLRLRLGARDRHHRSGVHALDAVDLPEAVRARPRVRGGRPDQLVPVVQDRASPTKRSARGAASAAAPSSCARTCASGCCASRATPTGCSRIWTSSTGRRRRWRCSATGSAAARGRGDVHDRDAGRGTASCACSRPGPTRSTARRTWCCRPSTRWSTS